MNFKMCLSAIGSRLVRVATKKTGRLKPRLYRQNPPPRVEEQAIKIQYGWINANLRREFLALAK